MQDKVEAELDRLVKAPLNQWIMQNGQLRLYSTQERLQECESPVSKLHCYPITRVEDLLATLSKWKVFSKLDLIQVYQQLILDLHSQKFVVINTHKSLFHFTQLPFSISSALGIFQKTMEILLRGIPGVSVFIDDILISHETKAEHLELLMRLASVGLRVKHCKCKFLVPLRLSS